MEQLNLKAKNFKDLLTDEPFTRKDIITIQVCHSFNVLKFIAGQPLPGIQQAGVQNDTINNRGEAWQEKVTESLWVNLMSTFY